MDRLAQLLDLLDDDAGGGSIGTSVRLPRNLRDAAVVATEMGLVESTSELTIRGLRNTLDMIAQRAILDEHYRVNPDARPDIAEIALATAQLDANPLAERAELVRRAADDVTSMKPDASPDDVLLYAAGLAATVR
ncbi:MAG: hypothetical protein ACR2G7_00755 [Acidimicrobiales bacterium]